MFHQCPNREYFSLEEMKGERAPRGDPCFMSAQTPLMMTTYSWASDL